MKKADRSEEGLLLGAHVSVAGGVATAPPRGGALGCTAIQVFTKNASQWRAPALREDEGALFRAGCREHGVRMAIAHASYLLNLASPKKALWRRSVEALTEELERCARIGLPYLVVHPGAHLGSGEAEALKRIAEAVNLAISAPRTRPASILLETMAGQGTVVCSRFEELAELLACAAEPERVQVCLDTCHVFAAGYDLRDEAAYERTLSRLDQTVGLERVRAVHVNDSRRGLGARIDRHADIGKGEIGIEAFRLLLCDSRLRGRPFILETPKGADADRSDRRNLKQLRDLAFRAS